MGEPNRKPVSSAFAAAFRAAAAPEAMLRFDRFMDLALYHPGHGYYRQARHRVGRTPGTDFYTASSSAPVFGDLVAAAAVSLLKGRPPSRFRFVEIGAEPDGGVLRDVVHPFAEVTTIRVDAPLRLDGPCIVFSNELFDAQPFRRFVKRPTGWQEVHVWLKQDDTLSEVEAAATQAPFLPDSAAVDSRIDAPVAAAELACRVASQEWQGVFIAFDYGKTWDQLVSATPQGTARAYRGHRQLNDLLADPGEQDLTCHVCWDWLKSALTTGGFASPHLDSQEAFFIRYAAHRIETLMKSHAHGAGAQVRALTQLLHPAWLGQKFEVLHASRFPLQDCP